MYPSECDVNLPVQLLIFRLIWVKVLALRLAILIEVPHNSSLFLKVVAGIVMKVGNGLILARPSQSIMHSYPVIHCPTVDVG